MSKLERMIAELCPNGVEFKTIGTVCELFAGGDVSKDRLSPCFVRSRACTWASVNLAC